MSTGKARPSRLRRSGRVCRSNGFSRGSDFLWRRISAAGRGSRPELAQAHRELCAPEDRPEQRTRRNRPDFIADLGRATHEQQHRYARDGSQAFAAWGTCWRGSLHRRCSFVIGATGSSCRHRRNQRCYAEEQTLCQRGRSRASPRTERNSAAFTMLRIRGLDGIGRIVPTSFVSSSPECAGFVRALPKMEARLSANPEKQARSNCLRPGSMRA